MGTGHDLAALAATFRANGHCVIIDALSAGELADLREAAEALLLEPPQDGGGKFHDIGKGESRRFLRHRHEDFPSVKAFVLGERMGQLSRALLGSDHSFLFNEQFVVKGTAQASPGIRTAATSASITPRI